MTKLTDSSWKTVSKASEVPPMSMKYIEIEGKEVAIINHMNAPLSKGEISNVQGKNIVTCPLHRSTYDIITGKNLSGPVKPPPVDMSAVPKPLQDSIAFAAQISAYIRVHDLETFKVEKDVDDIKLKINSG